MDNFVRKLLGKINKIFTANSLQEILALSILFLLPFYFIKFKYSWLSFNLVEILIVVLFFVWFFDKNTRYKIQNTRYYIPVLLILAGVALSTLVNKNYYVGLGIIKGWFFLPIVFAIIFFDNLKKNEKILNWSLVMLFYSGILVSIEGIYYWLSGILTYDGRLRIFFDSPNQLAMFLAPVFLIGLFLFLKEVEKKKKTITTVGLLLIGLNLFLTFSYGAWLSLAIVSAISLVIIMKNNESKITLVVFTLFFLLFLFFYQKDNFSNTRLFGERSSLASRLMIWKSAALIIEKNPISGVGPGNFQNKYLEYQKYFPPYLEWAVPQPHNLYLAFWLEAGFIGLIGFSLLVIQFFRDNKKAIGNNRLYGTLCLAAVLYYLVHGLVDTTYWRNDMAVVFWTIIVINVYLANEIKNQIPKTKNTG